ncbi:MAG: patatin-like phospholipase family protein [Nanobdellota archaeon]
MKITKKAENKTLGLALCSGGARGFANIGVLKELLKNNIFPDYIAGSSMGAIVAGLYSNGYSIDEIEKIAIKGEWKENLKFTVPKCGLIEGEHIIKYLKKNLKFKSFSKLKIPTRIISTNIDSGRSYVFEKGDSAKAVYASLAIPGIFTPLVHRKMTLVDGGIISPLPTQEIREMGADVVLGVDLSTTPQEMQKRKDNILGFSQESEFINYMKNKFKESQKHMLKDYIINTRKSVPDFAKNTVKKTIDKFYNPDKIMQKINLGGQFEVFDILSKTMYVMTNQLILEKINKKNHDFIIKPSLNGTGIISMDNIKSIIDSGQKECKKHIPYIKRKLSNRV